MRVLITGASSGIGRDIARYLSHKGYDLILVARNKEKLLDLCKELKTQTDIIIGDLSNKEECEKVYNEVVKRYKEIDILINNAGFGLCGEFVETDLETELSMIDTNIKAVHILTKLFLRDFVKKDKGKILNVASIAGFMPGPLMATYYSTKAYIVRFSQAISEELRRKKSNVSIHLFCPGPVNTNFNNVANVKFAIKGFSSEYAAKYAVDRMLEGKKIIIPGIKIKATRILAKIIPDKIMAFFCYKMQKRKI